MDARGLKGEREIEDDLEKNRQERAEQGRVNKLECGQSSGAEQDWLVRQRDGLLARRELWITYSL